MNDTKQIPDAELTAMLNLLLHKVGFRRLQKLGFHLQPNDFYSPVNDCEFLEANPDLWREPVTPAAIDWRVDAQLAVAREVAEHVEELRDVPAQPPGDGSAFGWDNGFWNNADAMVQYGLVRSRKPRRYVEVGCGWSSLLLARALKLNAAQGARAEVTLVEPYPNLAIFAHLPKEWQVHRVILQRADLGIFERLEAGDIFFYDGSHCAKVASDVNWFFFRILPRLKPGVIIHLHDIFMPEEFPAQWVFERGQTWNEQYVLQAFLMNNSSYEILIANRFLLHHRRAEIEALHRGIQPALGCSFWMQKIKD
jgi:predicted O-methyltransferase YrrM